MIQQLQPATWMQEALFVDLLLAFAAALGVLLCLRALYVLGRQDRGRKAEGRERRAESGEQNVSAFRLPPSALRSRSNQGMATIEFALVMPVVLFLMLVLIQTMLLMAGQLFVHYAAYAATRAAIVQIPLDLSQRGEPINVISIGSSSGKFGAIERAAVLAVMPVCGRDDASGGSQVDGEEFASALRQHYEMLGETTPRWVDTLAAERYCYAAEHTRIDLIELITDADGSSVQMRTLTGGTHSFGMKDPVAVRVEHRFNLSVPYVRAIFADAKMPTKHGETAYTNITALQMLTLEGVDPAMPMEPTLPRRDQRIR
ncbi:MAG: pilus assembly protein [Phycisphaeraceae bacterium]|nr:pilus assembly protein [Phycisphaeraceae bacterium]